MPISRRRRDSSRTYPAQARQVAPPHPGAIILEILADQLGRHGAVRRAAIAIGMTPAGLGKVCNGVAPVTPATALRIAAFFRVGKNASPELWLRLQADYDLHHVRRELAAELAKIKPIEAKPSE